MFVKRDIMSLPAEHQQDLMTLTGFLLIPLLPRDYRIQVPHLIDLPSKRHTQESLPIPVRAAI